MLTFLCCDGWFVEVEVVSFEREKNILRSIISFSRICVCCLKKKNNNFVFFITTLDILRKRVSFYKQQSTHNTTYPCYRIQANLLRNGGNPVKVISSGERLSRVHTCSHLLSMSCPCSARRASCRRSVRDASSCSSPSACSAVSSAASAAAPPMDEGAVAPRPPPPEERSQPWTRRARRRTARAAAFGQCTLRNGGANVHASIADNSNL